MDPFLLFVFHVCHANLSVPYGLAVTSGERTFIFSLLCVMFLVFLSLFHMVSLVRYGI